VRWDRTEGRYRGSDSRNRAKRETRIATSRTEKTPSRVRDLRELLSGRTGKSRERGRRTESREMLEEGNRRRYTNGTTNSSQCTPKRESAWLEACTQPGERRENRDSLSDQNGSMRETPLYRKQGTEPILPQARNELARSRQNQSPNEKKGRKLMETLWERERYDEEGTRKIVVQREMLNRRYVALRYKSVCRQER